MLTENTYDLWETTQPTMTKNCHTLSENTNQLKIVYQRHYRYTHTHTHPFNGHFSGTTRVSRYQKGKTNLDFIEARDSEWQWHQLGHMQVCT